MRLAVSLGMSVDDPLPEWDRMLRAVDASGVTHVGISDVQTRTFEAYTQTSYVATHTTSVKVGPVVSNPITRHPAVVASAFAGLQKMTAGRAFLGIGTGDSAMRNLGLKPARLDDVREHVAVFRELIREGTALYRGNRCELPWAPEAAPEGVPVYVSAGGPRSLEMAGEIADGVIVLTGVSEMAVRTSLAAIERGARRSGRELADLDVWFVCAVNLSDEPGRALAEVTNHLAAQTSSYFRGSLEGKMVPDELVEPLSRFLAEYRYDQHMSEDSPNMGLLERVGIKDFVVDRFFVGGTPSEVRPRAAALEALGVHQLYFSLYAPGPLELLARIVPAMSEGS